VILEIGRWGELHESYVHVESSFLHIQELAATSRRIHTSGAHNPENCNVVTVSISRSTADGMVIGITNIQVGTDS